MIDQDYRGKIVVIIFNHNFLPFHVVEGTRIAQLIVERVSLPKLVEVIELEETKRNVNGFGSTGQD